MWKVKFFLVLVVVIAVSATTQPPKNSSKAKIVKEKEPKEKRESPTSAPYSYEAPHKTFISPVHVNQQKHTSIDHYGQQHKVAPLEYQAKYEPQPQQQQQQYHFEQPQHHFEQQQQQYHPTSFNAPQMTPVEHLFPEHPVKELEDYSLNYPHFEAYSQFPGFYANEYEKVVAVPVKSFANLKSSPYSYQAPAASYNYPQHSYPSMGSYAPSIPAHYSSSFTQSPASIFIPQSVSVPHKQSGKTPDYAQGSKGLSHFSTVSSLAPVSSSYKSQHYEVPSYAAYTQTERPFKPSAFLGASVVSHDHHHYNERPAEQYIPAKSYPQQQQYAAQAAPVEYQIQYVQVPAGKSYQSPSTSYLPSKSVTIESPKSSYLPSPVAPTKSYLPPQQAAPVKVEQIKNAYLPPQNSYLPPNNPYASSHSHYHYQQQPQSQQQQQQQHYQPQQQSHEVYDSAEYQSLISGHHHGHK